MNQATLNTYVRQHELWLSSRGRKGVRADFSNKDLSGLRLHKANLKWAKFNDTNLASTMFENVNLELAEFNKANLNLVDWRYCHITTASFIEAVFVNAKFYKVDFSYSNFTTSAMMCTKLISCKLCRVCFRHNFVEGADFTDCDFQDALVMSDLSKASICNVNFGKERTILGADKYKVIVSHLVGYILYFPQKDVVKWGNWNNYKGGSLKDFEKEVSVRYLEDSIEYKKLKALIRYFKENS